MKRSPILLGIRRVKKNKDSKQVASAEELDEDEWEPQYDLMVPDQVVIVDDANIYQIFGDSIFTAPQEDLLEGQFRKSSHCARLISQQSSTLHSALAG